MSASSSNSTLHANITKISTAGLFECSICYTLFGTNSIFQCPQGHLMCESCTKLLQRSYDNICQTCKTPLPKYEKIRNLALEILSSKLIEMNMIPTEPPISHQNDEAEPSITIIHEGVLCDGLSCANAAQRHDFISGPRFKCLNCPNYDLCSECVDEGKRSHDESHVFARIGFPNTNLGAVKDLSHSFQNADIPSPILSRLNHPVDLNGGLQMRREAETDDEAVNLLFETAGHVFFIANGGTYEFDENENDEIEGSLDDEMDYVENSPLENVPNFENSFEEEEGSEYFQSSHFSDLVQENFANIFEEDERTESMSFTQFQTLLDQRFRDIFQNQED